MDCFLREDSFSPAPQPRTLNRPHNIGHNCLTQDFTQESYVQATQLGFQPFHYRDICETTPAPTSAATPRTMPRKPRRPKLAHTNTIRTQNQNSSDQSVFTPILQTRPSTANSFTYENTPKLKRPNAPPPPLPAQKSHGNSFESSILDSLSGYYNINPAANKTATTTASSSSDFMNSTFSASSNFSTPKMSRADLLFAQSNSTANLIQSDKNTGNHRSKSYNQYHIGFRHFEAEFVSPCLKKQSASYAPTTYGFSRKNRVSAFFGKIVRTLWPSSPGSFFNDSLFNYIVFFLGILLFLTSILCIILFQTKVHQFHSSLSLTHNSSNASIETYKAGSDLVRSTVQFCNGPYFSYQIDNLVVLPFSMCLLILFSFFSRRQSFCILRRSNIFSCAGSNRPGLPGTANPFQRRNRFLIAALYCIIANEIFKMVETSMFNVSDDELVTNRTELFFTKSVVENSNTDFLRIGFGIQPRFDGSQRLLDNLKAKLAQTTPPVVNTTRPLFIMTPSVMRYSKPKLPPRLNIEDFQSFEEQTPHLNGLADSEDIGKAIKIANGIHNLKSAKHKAANVVQSFNKSLTGSGTKTLFEVSMSLYQNEYIQKAVRTLFKSHDSFAWSLVLEKLEKLALMLLEVLIIGMRYYPLMSVLEKDSLVCLLFASIYMWADMAYNIVITGMCEGLKLNVSFDLLKDLRRWFGVGFILDMKENLNRLDVSTASESTSPQVNSEIDTNFLFSTNRIVYTIAKSLPHFFCLAYVTVRLSATFIKMAHKRVLKKRPNLTRPVLVDSKTYVDLIYTKKQIYGQVRSGHRPTGNLSFEERYVRNLFLRNSFHFIKKMSWLDRLKQKFSKTDNFRFSTRVVYSYTVCFTVLYYLTCSLIFYGSIFIDLIYWPVVYKYALVFSATMTSIISIVQLVLSMRQHKLHLKSLYKGTSDQYISPKSLFSNRKIASSSFNYSGYAVSYTIWGYVILFSLITFLTAQLATLAVFGNSSLVGLFLLVIFLPFIISIMLIYVVNRVTNILATKFCFLQRKSKVLALKNLESYSLFLYFKFFHDCLTGLAFCLIRLVKSVLIGVLFMSRIDYSFMGRNLERMDPAFMSYVGYLYWEAHHTNPIVIAFCDMLKRGQKQRRKNACRADAVNEAKRNRIVNRWQLAYLLIKNSSLVTCRRGRI